MKEGKYNIRNCGSWLAVYAHLFMLILMLTASLKSSPSIAKEQSPDANSAIERGDDFMLRNDYQSAMREYRLALDLEPDNAQIRRRLVELHLKVKDINSAIEEQLVIMSGNPTEEDYFTLGALYYGSGDQDAMLEILNQAAVVFPSEKAWYLLAEAYADAGKHNDAVDAYRKVLKYTPRNLEVRRKLVWSLWKNGNYETATDELLMFETRRERCIYFLSILGPFAPPFVISILIYFLVKNSHSRHFLCNSQQGNKYVLTAIKGILLVYTGFFIFPSFLFNPFSPDYSRKVLLSFSLGPTLSMLNPLQVFLSAFIPLFLLPALYLKRVGQPILSLFSIPQKHPHKPISFLRFGMLFLLLIVATVGLKWISIYSGLSGRTLHIFLAYRRLSLFNQMFVCTILPFMEEFGLIATTFLLLRRFLAPFWSTFFCALFFTSAHYRLGPGFFLVGFFIHASISGLLLQKTRSLWPSILFHISGNAASLLL